MEFFERFRDKSNRRFFTVGAAFINFLFDACRVECVWRVGEDAFDKLKKRHSCRHFDPIDFVHSESSQKRTTFRVYANFFPMSIRFDIITIFPSTFSSYLGESMMKRARAKRVIDVRVHDLREFSRDKHKKVDDRPYGGGPGMVVKLEPLVRAISSLKLKMKSEKVKVILFSAAGKQFNSKMASDWAKKYDRIVMIAGHYEGVDERVKKVIENLKFKIENLSIGPYILTGGELPALVVIDAVSRHIPGFLGKAESLEEKRHGVGVPAYTRPEVFRWGKKRYAVPKFLLSGDHARIESWRSSRARKRL